MSDPSRSLVYRLFGDDRGPYRLYRAPDGITRGVPGVTMDSRHFVEPFRVTMGRKGAGEEFGSATATWSYLRDDFPEDAILVGDRVQLLDRCPLWVTEQTIEFRRIARDDVPGARELVPVVTVTAVGQLARLSQIRIGARPFGPDNGWHRMVTTMQAETIDQTAAFDAFDGSPLQRGVETVQLRAADIDRSDPVALMRQYAADSGALVFESMIGDGLVWETLEGRRNREPVLTLTAAEVAQTATWERSLTGLVNRLTLTYGPEGDRHEVTVEDTASIALYGEYAAGRETELLNEADAQRVAQLTVGRNSRPRWTISRLDLDPLRCLDDAKRAALIDAEIGDLIEVTGLPGSAPYSRWLYLEGVDAAVDAHNWRMSLFLSEAGRTGAPLRWQDVNPALTWAEVGTVDEHGDPLTWLSSAGWFDPPTTGAYRWLDVPTDQQWWHIGNDYFGNPEARDRGDTRVPTWESYPDNPA